MLCGPPGSSSIRISANGSLGLGSSRARSGTGDTVADHPMLSFCRMHNDGSDNTFQIVVPGDPRSLALVRSFVGHLAANAGFDDVEAQKIEVAVDEACANIIEHAYSEMAQKPPVSIQIALREDDFVVQIVDEGKSFDKTNYRAPTFPKHWDDGNTRGVGVYLIHQCMDSVDFSKTAGEKNQLRLVKKRPRTLA